MYGYRSIRGQRYFEVGERAGGRALNDSPVEIKDALVAGAFDGCGQRCARRHIATRVAARAGHRVKAVSVAANECGRSRD